LFLAIQCFFAVLFGSTVPAKALPAPPPQPEGPSDEVKALQSKLEAAEKARDEAQAKLKEAEAGVEAKLKAANDAKAAAEGASGATADQLKAVEQEVGELRQAKAALETEKGELAARAEQAESELKAAEAAKTEAEEKLGNLEKRAEDAKAGVKEAEGKLKQARDDGALALLSWLQREGRLIDFLMESIDDYEDDQIGAAVRAIHSGCRKVIDEGLGLEPILPGEEEAQVEVPKDFDPVSIQLSGNVKGEPPFSGTLMHHGWKTSKVAVPVSETVDTSVLAPAEVEL
jgi:hypothetical protein